MGPGEFWAFIAAIIAIVVLFFLGMYMQIAYALFLILLVALIAVLFFVGFVKKYTQFERGVIFRLGKFNRIAGPGWAIVIPFFEQEYKRVDVRVKMMDVQSDEAFTQDDIRLSISGTIYYQIKDPEKATLQIDNYGQGLNTLIQSTIRNTVAGMTMRQVFGNIDRLNDIMTDAIRHATYQWGIDVPMVQLRTVSPPQEVVQAMIQPEISANLLQAQRFKADAQKIVMEAIGEGGKALDDRSIMYLYLQALKQMGESSSSKIVLPMQFFQGLGGMAGGLAGLSTAAIASLGGQQNVQNVIDSIKQKIAEAGKT
ncbi:MAG: SPFH/Band 7/PHB domain protein [Candidatus Parvarchaeota archaeon]|nr:SPFH/Band 7/PHB domain protein [Candidatus Parvarchaeota archaeon]MCW1301878.1 SPFH/Band 7/PHB domain protein [Candidatus Parvarchaeota archaeon]